MKPKVYLETSIISYLAARPSRNVVAAAMQRITQEFWRNRSSFDLYISQIVINEALRGDPQAIKNRRQYLQQFTILHLSQRAIELSEKIIADGILPLNAVNDALHISLSAVNKMDFLLSWNSKHIANANNYKKLDILFLMEGLFISKICTPFELLEKGFNHD